MQPLLSSTRRIPTFRWICHSCRGFTKEAKPREYTSLSSASHALRNEGPARTRFAPSPTGYLHLGSLRTALFNYLVAKATGGQFLLRIEDTDQKRTIPDAEARLFEDLEWAGIEWDEGPKIGGPFGPYNQSQRTALYREHAEKLLESGNAYRCFCTPERLFALAQHRAKLGLPPDYDRACTHVPREESDDRASKGESHVIRLKVPDKYPVYNDLVYGLVRQRGDFTSIPRSQGKGLGAFGSYDDPILLKSDGFPTYHLANVVDDHLMEITHVIRGSEWMSSTPKHLAMYQAFGWEPPAFAHVGLLLDKNKQKLSKRTGSIDISSYRELGIFPETLTNFVALLGWSHNVGRDIMSMKDLIRNASMKYTRGDSIVGFEKLDFLQKRHAARYASMPEESDNFLHSLRHLAVKPIVKLLDERLTKQDLPVYSTYPAGEAREDFISSILHIDAQNYTNPSDYIERNTHFFIAPTLSEISVSIPSFKLHKVPAGIPYVPEPETMMLFQGIVEITDDDWRSEVIRDRISWIIKQGAEFSLAALNEERGSEAIGMTEELDKVMSKAWTKLVHGYLRWAVAAGKPGPDGAEMMSILGRRETVSRLQLAEGLMMRQFTKEKAGEEGQEETANWV
ncbi:Glutamate--tRNA ligase mitochondrial [Cadophora gregata]|uniref:Glutamate--tRNA ligase mitochondrial n=1 Tax=Cadophora gregata TaxID=51156 RepID=UPI0026DAD3A0|nr:Glutamate--tRNA ligase mitochondrial [Cadophora gregata]KAK0125415.1 Glutamate--tRNA ligase mitochondrial [Cadophora gregata f. sp. sojae]KAK0128606.1 Glutamate--tRNA ligase mitochondrial [Cadophora gregata]